MHLLLSALGSTGDVYPTIGLGYAAAQRGHPVSILTSANFEPDVHNAGCEFVELISTETYESLRDSFEQQMSHGRLLWGPEKESAVYEIPQRAFDAVLAAYIPGETVLGMSEQFGGGGSIAAEAHQIPYASTWHNPVLFRVLQPKLPQSLKRWERAVTAQFVARVPSMGPMKRRLDALRKQAGLRPKNFLETFYYTQDANLCLFPRWYAQWYRDTSPNTTFSDFPRFEHVLDRGLPPSLEAFLAQGDRPVVVGTASWRADRTPYFQAAVRSCRELGLRVILQGQGSQPFAEGASDVYAADSLPYTSLLPRVAAFVHHGGIGSIASALAAGIPQVVVFRGTDTPYNARKVRSLGIGLGLKYQDFATGLTPILRRVLADTALAAKASELAARFSATPDLGPAVDALEALHARRRDVP